MIRNKVVLSVGSVILLFSLLAAMVGCSSHAANSVAFTQPAQSEAVSSSLAESETAMSSLLNVSSSVSSTVSSAVSSTISKSVSTTASKAISSTISKAVSSTAPKTVSKSSSSVSSTKPSSSKPQSSSSAVTSSASSNAASDTEAKDIMNYKKSVQTIMGKIDNFFNTYDDFSFNYDEYSGTKTQAMEFFNGLEAILLELEQLAAPQPYIKVQASLKQDCAQVISSCETIKQAISSSTTNTIPIVWQNRVDKAGNVYLDGLIDIGNMFVENNLNK